MQTRLARATTIVIAVITLVSVMIPLGYLLLSLRPNQFDKMVNAPGQYDLNPVSYYLCIGLMLAICGILILALILSSAQAIFGFNNSGRNLFYSLAAVSGYVGSVAVLRRLPYFDRSIIVSSTIANLGFMVFCWSGLPLWGPALLWWSGSTRIDHDPSNEG